VKRFRIPLGLLLLAALVYIAGPKPAPPVNAPSVSLPDSLNHLEQFIDNREASLPVKPDNKARIIWADSTKKVKTPYSVVYIHGFSASYGEGDPFHRELAAALNANLFVARLAHHGLTVEQPFIGATADDFIGSAAEAFAIGRALGDRVIIAATSMGGALALNEAARDSSALAALLLYSPLIDFKDPTSTLLNKPWAGPLAKLVAGGDRYIANRNPNEGELQYWYPSYHINGLIAVKAVQNIANNVSLWKKISLPVFVGYYYKDEEHQDQTVSVPALLRMADGLATPSEIRRVVNFPEAGAHVITSKHTTSVYLNVLQETLRFLHDTVIKHESGAKQP
jgi:pimeloyl-ACP methyl ester carboxylesterase